MRSMRAVEPHNANTPGPSARAWHCHHGWNCRDNKGLTRIHAIIILDCVRNGNRNCFHYISIIENFEN